MQRMGSSDSPWGALGPFAEARRAPTRPLLQSRAGVMWDPRAETGTTGTKRRCRSAQPPWSGRHERQLCQTRPRTDGVTN
jgi:hypothetical protein